VVPHASDAAQRSLGVAKFFNASGNKAVAPCDQVAGKEEQVAVSFLEYILELIDLLVLCISTDMNIPEKNQGQVFQRLRKILNSHIHGIKSDMICVPIDPVSGINGEQNDHAHCHH